MPSFFGSGVTLHVCKELPELLGKLTFNTHGVMYIACTFISEVPLCTNAIAIIYEYYSKLLIVTTPVTATHTIKKDVAQLCC